MAGLKETFNKGLTTINVKTNNFMKESKCKTYITTLENEIAELKKSLGEKVYANWLNKTDVSDGVETISVQIRAKYEEIEVQKAKILQLQEEEKLILGAGQRQMQTPGTQNEEPEGETIFCSQCGMKNSVNYKFCCKCGAPLK